MQLILSRRFAGVLAAAVALSELASFARGVSMASQRVATLPAKVEASSTTGLLANQTHAADSMPTKANISSVTGRVANQTYVASNRQNSSGPIPGSFAPKLQAVVSNLSQTPLNRSAHFMSPRIVSPDMCSCEFRDLCSCEAVIQFMNCITDRCNSGGCVCEDTQFQHACESVAGACSIEMHCTAERATCVVEEEAHLWLQNRTKTVVYEELLNLKESKCRLELAAEDGWLNADFKLRSVSSEIEKRMQELRVLMAPLPEMHCAKHFEEWHEEHLMKDDSRSSSRREAPRSVMLQASAAFAAVFVTVAM